jgi:hypothetical protein
MFLSGGTGSMAKHTELRVWVVKLPPHPTPLFFKGNELLLLQLSQSLFCYNLVYTYLL